MAISPLDIRDTRPDHDAVDAHLLECSIDTELKKRYPGHGNFSFRYGEDCTCSSGVKAIIEARYKAAGWAAVTWSEDLLDWRDGPTYYYVHLHREAPPQKA